MHSMVAPNGFIWVCMRGDLFRRVCYFFTPQIPPVSFKGDWWLEAKKKEVVCYG